MHIVRYHTPSSCNSSPFAYQGCGPRASLANEVDRLLESAFASLATPTVLANQIPVEIEQDTANAYVRAELPGVKREDISVEVLEGNLKLQASRLRKTGDTEEKLSFSRSLRIGDEFQSDKVSASYENGILTLTLPRKEEAKPLKITVPVT
jgi:HSP20 family protein